jgi:hypothetical protein
MPKNGDDQGVPEFFSTLMDLQERQITFTGLANSTGREGT